MDFREVLPPGSNVSFITLRFAKVKVQVNYRCMGLVNFVPQYDEIESVCIPHVSTLEFLVALQQLWWVSGSIII